MCQVLLRQSGHRQSFAGWLTEPRKLSSTNFAVVSVTLEPNSLVLFRRRRSGDPEMVISGNARPVFVHSRTVALFQRVPWA